jgi:tetratricopeptide (TPR) repeat protein
VSDAFRRGLALLDLNRPHDALEPLARAVAEDPEDPEAQLTLAGALWETGDAEGTRAAAARGCALDPENPEGPLLLSLACDALGWRGEALTAAREAVRLAPESARCLVVLSSAELAAGHVAAAADAARHAIERAPGYAAAHHQSGMILLRYGHWRDAAEAFEEVLRLDPESASAQNNLALARFQMGDTRGAVAGFERAARTDPQLGIVRDNLEQYGVSPLIIVLYALAVAALVGGVVWTSLRPGAAPVALLAGAVLAFPAIGWLERRVHRLSGPSAARLDDERRRRRYRPWQWRWTRPIALQSWWYARLGPVPRVVIFYGGFAAGFLAIGARLGTLVFLGRGAFALYRIGERGREPRTDAAWSEADADAAMREQWARRDEQAAARERALLRLRRPA